MADKIMLSNVIGAPFDRYVLAQLYQRAARNSTISRSTEEILFLANKMAWVRMISSVNVALPNYDTFVGPPQPGQPPITAKNTNLGKFYQSLGIEDLSNYPDGTSLAKRWVLEAGTSITNGKGIDLRAGLGGEGAYGLGGIEEQGYRPMPGLTSVTIDTAGRLGSLRIANINFKVWNMNQLNTIEALYFRLGYSMLLEWGHVQYFKNDGVFETKDINGIDDPFRAKLRKEDIQQEITIRSKRADGNYDGMLGIVSNFTWSFNQEGGYDCNVKLIGLGSIMDSLRINQVYKLPDGLIEELKKNQSVVEQKLAAIQKAQDDAKKAEEKKKEEELLKKLATTQPTPPPKNYEELFKAAVKDNPATTDSGKFKAEVSYPYVQSFGNEYSVYYYKSTSKDKNQREQADINTFGLFVPSVDFKRIAAQNYAGTYLFLNYKLIGEQLQWWENSSVNSDFAKLVQTENAKAIALGVSLDTELARAYFAESSKEYYTGAYASPSSNPRYREPNATMPAQDTVFNFTYQYGSNTEYYFAVSFKQKTDFNYPVTRLQVANAIDSAIGNAANPHNVKRVEIVDNKVQISTEVQVTIDNVAYDKTKPKGTQPFPPKSVVLTFGFTFTNPGLIYSINTVPPSTAPTPSPAGTANTGDADGANNTTGTEQADQAFESALAAMLIFVKAKLEAQSNPPLVLELDISGDTKKFYKDGALAGVIDYQTKPSTNAVPFELTAYAKKGFCSALMADPNAYSVTPDVNYADLCKAYLIQYKQAATELTIESMQFPVYITLGYLLAFLNNMCLIYDTTSIASTAVNPNANAKRPYLYIDFNPETNFCLTSPQQLSIDPTICMIPFEGSQPDYAGIYDKTIYEKLTTPFNPDTDNYVSGFIPKYKTDKPYKAKMMNILLNVDYLLNMAKSFSTSDPEHSVNLKRFLETVMVDVNKALGNFNVFRVSYRDDSNTIQIKDDQFVPSDTQDTIIEKTSYKTRNAISELKLPATYTQADLTSLNYGQLPIFGAQSLARTFQFKTNMSTKLGSMIAISAQAATGSINAKDPSSLSYLNSHYEDRYKNRVVNPSSGPAQQTTITQAANADKNNDEIAATAFDTHIKSIYSSNLQLDAGKIEPSKNYYVERSAIFKTDNSITSGAPFIPADLEITIDGIGGIIMGQAFTIPENRMPASLRGDDGITKVGFIVGGLTHTIENNQWLTKIKGQMIRLREDTQYGSTQVIKKLQAPTTTIPVSGASTKGFDKNNIAKATKYLISRGYSNTAASAVVGSLLQESRLIPTIVNYDKRKSYNDSLQTYAAGIAQWVGPRRVNLLNFAKAKGIAIPDFDKAVAVRGNSTKRPDSAIVIKNAFSALTLDVELEFLVQEMQKYPGFAQFKTTADLQFAIKWMYETYEGGNYTAGAALGGRGSYATTVLNDLKSGKI